MNDEAFEAVLIVLDALAAIGTPAFVGGSLASAIFGTPCSAIDADLVALMRTGHADRQWSINRLRLDGHSPVTDRAC